VTIWVVLGTIGIVAVVIAAGVALDRRFGLLPRPRELRDAARPGLKAPTYAAGEAPETALEEPPSTVRCRSCGRAARPLDESRATLGDRELVVRRYRCERCGAIATMYCRS
jgi:rubredoxin